MLRLVVGLLVDGAWWSLGLLSGVRALGGVPDVKLDPPVKLVVGRVLRTLVRSLDE